MFRFFQKPFVIVDDRDLLLVFSSRNYDFIQIKIKFKSFDLENKAVKSRLKKSSDLILTELDYLVKEQP